eukprot:scaffold22612_cov138-Cylindrotheca_fusiformis.AAC.3
MDIRNFFGVKPAGSKKKKKTSSIAPAKDNNDDGGGNVKSHPKKTKSSNNNDKNEKVEDKKRKVVEEISPEDYFASDNSSSSPNNSPPSPKKQKVINAKPKAQPRKAPSPATAKTIPTFRKMETKRRRVEESEDDDDDDDSNDATMKSNEKIRGSPRKKIATSHKPKTKTPSPKQTKSSSSSSSRKESPKAAAVNIPILEPSLDRDSFDEDSCQVSEFLQGLTFVFTGILPNLHRDDAVDLIKTFGGRVTGSVSGKTSYLVVGTELEDGRHYTEGKKYKMAMEKKKVQICLGEQRLYGLCHLYHERAKKERGISDAPKKPTVIASKAAATTAATSTSSTKPAAANPYTTTKKPVVSANPYAKKPVVTANPYAKKPVAANPYANKAKANPYATTASGTSSTQQQQQTLEDGPNTNSNNISNQLWADRHAPQTTRDILGNKENITKLAKWLDSWERNFNNSKAAKKTFSNPKQGPWKAALLSGPPGIGKTTTATLVAKEAGRDLLEFNASDARSKKTLQSTLGDLTGSQALSFGPVNGKKKSPKKLRCIVMDEVDGMGAGDRSGMAELIQMIKKSMVPIICICNDRQSQKMKSLLPYCLDLRFRRPVKSTMANRAMRIAKLEGMDVERNAAEAIAESCGNDVRQVMNCLQMWAQKKNTAGGNDALTYKNLKERQSAINKDEILRVGLFDAAKTIIEGRKGISGADPKTQRDSFFRRTDAFFVDYSLTGLLAQQNYLKVMLNQRSKALANSDSEIEFLERVHDAAASMSDYAVCEHEIRSGDLNWSLLPTCSVLAVKTGYHAGGEEGGFLSSFPEFSAWMGKNSSKGKKQRLLNELHHHMNFKISGDSQQMRQTYLPALRERLLSCFKEGGDTSEIITLMDTYGLSREDVMEKFDEFRVGKQVPAFADLDSKQKAAFTREYNKGSHKSQALVAEQGGGGGTKKKSKGGKREKDPGDLDAIDEDDDDVEEEESDVDDEAEMKKLQEKFKKKGRKGATKKAATKKGKK